MNNSDLSSIEALREVMAHLRAPDGCPWDKVQTHESIAANMLEEAAELIDAIEQKDDTEMQEELGDVLMQVVFHAQMAQERDAFTFEDVVRGITEKLIRRHPHVFATAKVNNVEGVWDQWEKIKRAEKTGTEHERKSALDGVPINLNALMRAQKLFKKALKNGILTDESEVVREALSHDMSQQEMANALCAIAIQAQKKGWDAETLLRNELREREKRLRQAEQDKQ